MITIKKAVKRYGNFELKLDMEIPEGRITGLVGKNGAGKSTTIRLILGLAYPDEGCVTLLGQDSLRLSGEVRRQIGAALAESGFSPYMKITDIVKVLKKSYPDFEEERFGKGCRELGLPTDQAIRQFSTGMKAKLRVLIAITHKARLLILDEPTAGLDVEARVQVLDMIRAYMEEDESRSVLITSHISSDLETMCDDIYLIHKGELILHEETDVILSRYGILKVDEETYEALDRRFLLSTRKEWFGYTCFTNELPYYVENYPGITAEKGSIDEMILMMGGEKS